MRHPSIILPAALARLGKPAALFAAIACASFSQCAYAQLTTIASFRSGDHVMHPGAGLVQGSNGDFYGTTPEGGSSADCGTSGGKPIGCGIAYSVTAGGVFTELGAFGTPKGAATGWLPYSSLIQGRDGKLYGTTYSGGSDNSGSVFSMLPSGDVQTIVSFDGTNGAQPVSGLLLASDGNFYGTTYTGGANFNCPMPFPANMLYCGTVFKMTPTGELSTLVSFDYATTGGLPVSALIQGKDGNLYGMTSMGGTGGGGTVFRLTTTGELTVLASITTYLSPNPIPYIGSGAGLTQGQDGNLYGTLWGGGTGRGSIFQLTPGGVLTTLVTFDGTNGAAPDASLVQGSDGNFYGTTSGESPIPPCTGASCGTLFKMTPAGKLSTLVTFTGANGNTPVGTLVLGSDGNFYGVTEYGGSHGIGSGPFPYGYGTFFKFNPTGPQ